jgi:general secretion pathway protein G
MKKTIIIVLVLATVWFLYGVMGYFLGSRTISKLDLEASRMNTIPRAIDDYYKFSGQYPVELNDLVHRPAGLMSRWEGAYIHAGALYDPWGKMFIYEPNSSNPVNYNITSYGADGKPGGKGENRDISLLNFTKQRKLAKTEQKIEEVKALVIKTITPGFVLLLLWAIAIYKYKTRPKVFQNMQ